MICPQCNKPMSDDGEYPYTHQVDGVMPSLTHQCYRWTCVPCDVYVYQGMDNYRARGKSFREMKDELIRLGKAVEIQR